ncbi:MAG: V-type ATPase subunit [Deltaproteobacteria bacterium]|nr:V-type ATPase subunit [Deltaproteobacteria bacterium]MBZ0219993.1 V-type ATPase subunit [Deltaproteobacteria bacterium]
MPASRPSHTDLSYFNARVRGLRGKLLKSQDYEALIQSEGPAQAVDRLRSSAYGPDIEAALARFVSVEEAFPAALKSSLSDSFELLWKLAPEGARPFLKAVFSIWEIFDLKAIIRGISRGVRSEDIRDVLIPAGELDTAALNTLLSSRDLQDLAGFLRTWGSIYAKPVSKGLPAFIKNGRTAEMEIALDRHSAEALLSALEGEWLDVSIMRGWAAMRVDFINITTLVKISGEAYTPEGAGEFFVRGGKALRKNEFIRLSELKKREELFDALRGLITEPAIKGVLDSGDPRDPALLEESAEKALEKRLAATAVSEPLSIALGAAYIHMKVGETRNLRLIFRGKLFGMPEDEIKKLMFLPL